MAGIPLVAFVIGLIETAVIFAVFWAIFRLFNANTVVRNWIVYAASYPGTFAAVGGWIGVVVPIPAILGVPLVFVTGQLTGANDAGWLPAPFMTFTMGFEGPTPVVAAFLVGEIALVIAWILAIRLIHTRFSDR